MPNRSFITRTIALAFTVLVVAAAIGGTGGVRARLTGAEQQVKLAQRSRDGLQPRSVAVKPARTALTAGLSDRVLHVKFREGSTVRVRRNAVVSLASDDIGGVRALAARHPGIRFVRMYSRPELRLAREVAAIERRSGRALADPNLWYQVVLPKGSDIAKVADEFNALPIVEIAYPEPLPVAAPTPDYSAQQAYGSPAGTGVGAFAAQAKPGGTGDQVQIFDVEYSWNVNHEDLGKAALPGTLIPNGTPQDPFNDNNHGTAVLGEMVADNNGSGVLGLAHGATLRLVNANRAELPGYRLAEAIDLARSNANRGDVILIEQQTTGPNGCDGTTQVGCVPVEWFQGYYDAIVTAAAAGIYVIEPAANGSQNLGETATYGDPFPLGRADSGAIMVGAGGGSGGSCGPVRQRLTFSNYGPRVDVQGWGECVVTTGYGGLQGSSQSNDAYTNTFGGTSSASPIVASAVAVYSSILQTAAGDNTDALPSPQEMREALKAFGTAQANPGGQNIGPLPNLAPLVNDVTPPAQPTATVADAATHSAAYTTGNVVVSITGTDNVGVARYFAGTSASTPAASDPGWKPTSDVPLALSGADGLVSVYFWTSDGLNNISPSGVASIERETVPPTAALRAPAATKTRSLPITMTGTDAASGVAGYLVSQRGATPALSDPRWVATPPTSYSVTGPAGKKTLFGWTKDIAGNISARAQDTVIFDGKAPIVKIMQPLLNSRKSVLRRISGTVADNVSPAAYRRADFAIGKRLSATRCAWWNPNTHAFQNAACAAPKRFAIRIAGNTPDWGRSVGGLSVPGTYFLSVRYTDQAGNIGAANVSKFEITGPPARVGG